MALVWLAHVNVADKIVALNPAQQAVYEANGWTVTTAPVTLDEDWFRELWTWDIGRPGGVAGLDENGDIIGGGGGGGLTTEQVQDLVAAMVNVTHTGVTVAYNDTAGTLTFTATGGGSVDAEVVRDTIATALGLGTNTGITVTPNDVGDSISIAVDVESEQDRVAAMFDGSHSGVTVAYNDTTGKITITSTASTAIGDRTITGTKLVLNTIGRTEVNSAEIPAFNVDGSLDILDSAVGVEPDADTASSHGWVMDLVATVVALLGGSTGGSDFSGQAADVLSSSTLAQGNVEDDLSYLDATKADGAEVQRVFQAFTDTNGISTPVGDVTGIATRSLYVDDFRWSQDATSSGSIGETRCLRDGGASANGTNSAFRPGVIQLGSGTVSGTWAVLHAPGQVALNLAGNFEAHLWFRPVLTGSDMTLRAGLSVLPTSEAPADGVYIEKLPADSAFWRYVTRTTAGGENRALSVVPTTANQYVHARIRRLTTGTVGFSIGLTVGGIAQPLSGETSIAFTPTTALARLFVGVKSTGGTSRLVDVDRWQTLAWDLMR